MVHPVIKICITWDLYGLTLICIAPFLGKWTDPHHSYNRGVPLAFSEINLIERSKDNVDRHGSALMGTHVAIRRDRCG